MIKLCKPAMEPNPDALLDRIRAIEMQLEQGIPSAEVKEKVVYVNADEGAKRFKSRSRSCRQL